LRTTRGISHSEGTPKEFCRERLRKALVAGKRLEWVFCRIVGLGTTLLGLFLVVGWLMDTSALSIPSPDYLERENWVAKELRESEGSAAYEASIPDEVQEETREIVMKRGDGLEEAMRRGGLSPQQTQEIVEAIRPIHDPRKLKEGTRLWVTFDENDGSVKLVQCPLDIQSTILVEREGGRLRARKEVQPTEVRQRVVSGTIQNSLFGAMEKAGLPASMATTLASIFEYDVDFHVDIRKGDRFDLLIEEKWIGNTKVGYGKILAARLCNKGRTFWAFRFGGKATQEGYFDMDGKSLRKSFLRSPLKFTRITSGFSHARFHPILETYRPHLGVDYAAPSGTPVRAVADGKVIEAGWNGGFGNQVKIQHGQSYVSMYGHLSKFGPGIRPGVTVRQGQVIGYVGATGLATGPHLDFRLMRGGDFVNPLKVNFVNGEPVNPKEMAAFKSLVAQRSTQLEKGPLLAGSQGKDGG